MKTKKEIQDDANKKRYSNTKRFCVDIEKNQALAFKEKLKKENTTFSDWTKKKIEKYLKNN